MNRPVQTAAPVLSIAVIGVGSIGSAFAFYLAQAGHEVTAIARPGSDRLAQLMRDQGVVNQKGELAAMLVSERLDEEIAYDLVLVTTLAHQTDAILPALKASRAHHVQFMFNMFDPERLSGAVGGRPVSFGMPFVMAHLDAEGVLQAQTSRSRKTLHGDRRWAELFEKAGLPSAFEPSMALWLRCHAPMCIAMESVCFAGHRRGGGATWTEALGVARGLKAGFSIVVTLGFKLHPADKMMISRMPAPWLAGLLWGVSRITAFRELLATGVHECRALIDTLVAASAEADQTQQGAAARAALRSIRP